jgi:toxin ParE1/3/4
MTSRWTKEAVDDLSGIVNRIKADSQYYALLVADRIIEQFPYSGQMVPEYQREEIREVVTYSYRLIYRVDTSTIWVLAIIHGARPLPEIEAIDRA